jgi:hypothetical protein
MVKGPMADILGLGETHSGAEIVDYVESWIFNSDKCFAIFRP